MHASRAVFGRNHLATYLVEDRALARGMLSGCVAPVAIAGDNVSRSNCKKRAASDLLYEHLKAREIFSSKRTSPTHAIHEPASSVMNAVEYCLLHGLKLAGPEHPAILRAQESLSYGALAARHPKTARRPAKPLRGVLWPDGGRGGDP